MIKPIVKDIVFLGQKSEPATKDDIAVIDDLTDTLRANFKSRLCTHMNAPTGKLVSSVLVSICDIIHSGNWSL